MDNYEALVSEIRHGGNAVETRLGPARERLSVRFDFSAGYIPYRNKLNLSIGWTEFLQLVAGEFTPDVIARVAPRANLKLFTEHMAYGPRIATQVPLVLDELRANPDSRRAVLYVGHPENGPTDRIPCTSTIQFLIRKGRLFTIVSMRSWDLIKGLPYDVMMFGGLTQVIASLLGIKTGYVTVYAGSGHVYESDHASIPGPQRLYFRLTDGLEDWEDARCWARRENEHLERPGTPNGIVLSEVER